MTRERLSSPFFHRALKPVVLACVLLSPVFLGWPASHAQGTSVEELERRLQKAKDEKARRDAAAAKAREEAEAERKRKEAEAGRAAAERRAQEARQANLVVQTDAPCTLSVNGRETAQLPKGITEVKVSPGQKLVSCASSEEKTTFEGELEARSGQDTVLRIALGAKVAEIRRARAAALEREAEARREAEAQARKEAEARDRAEAARLQQERLDRERVQRALATMNSRLQPLTDSVLFDSKWGLQWTRSDNGWDVNWADAQAHCRGLVGGWSLPTANQLESLRDLALPGIKCGAESCKVSELFRLDTAYFWSSDIWTIKTPSRPSYSTGVSLSADATFHVYVKNVDRVPSRGVTPQPGQAEMHAVLSAARPAGESGQYR